MTSYASVSGFLVTTDANTNKNLSSEIFTFSQSAQSLPSGTYTVKSYSVPLSTATRLYQIYVNLSIDGDVWTALPARDRMYSNNRKIAMNLAQSGNIATLDVYFINQDGSTRSFADMTISVIRRDFVDEI